MMSRCRSIFCRRHLAFISMTVRAGDSSMKMRARESASPASLSFSKSRSLMNPVRLLDVDLGVGAEEADDDRLLDISIEKKPTALSVLKPTYWEMFRPGRSCPWTAGRRR